MRSNYVKSKLGKRTAQKNYNKKTKTEKLEQKIKELEKNIFSLEQYAINLEILNDKLQIRINQLVQKGKEVKWNNTKKN